MTQQNNGENLSLQPELFRIRKTDSLDVLVSRLDTQGNILRRTCTKMGASACAQVCAARGGEEYYHNADKRCADRNLVEAFVAANLRPTEMLMVGATANFVGFADELPALEAEGKLKTNPEGFKEIVGYNAFFARKGEGEALGCRLADCGHVVVEFTDRDGTQVMGFMHLTRSNMQGETAYAFDYNGRKVSYFEYALNTAIEHYRADFSGVKVMVNAAISEEYYDYRFKDEAHIRELFPGWLEEGLIRSEEQPNWRTGESFAPSDTWHLNFPELIKRHIERAGLTSEQINMGDMLDPGDSGGAHSSNNFNTANRDLYAVAFTK